MAIDPDDTWEARMTPRPKIEPKIQLLEMVWRIVGPSGRVFTCGIYATAAGIELRSQFSDDNLLRSQHCASMEAARELAEEWKQAVLAKGSFTELDREGA